MWKNVRVNIQNVQSETDKAILIKMPNKSKYKDFCFWVSKKVVRYGSHGYELSVGLNSTFQYNLKRTGKNFKVLDEVTLTADEIEACFN